MKKLLALFSLLLILFFAAPAFSTPIYVIEGVNYGNLLKTKIDYKFLEDHVTFTVQNLSEIQSTITAFAFNAPDQKFSDVNNWHLHYNISPPDPQNHGNFSSGLGVNSKNWNGANPNSGIKQGQSATFTIKANSFNLSENNMGNLFAVRYQQVGPDQCGSDVGSAGINPVPEPATVLLLGIGLGVLGLTYKSKSKSKKKGRNYV